MRKSVCLFPCLFLALLLLLMPLAVFAEDTPPAPSTDVIYLSGDGEDFNNGKTEETALKSLEAATAALPKGGTILVVGDTEINLAGTEVAKSAHRIYLAPSKSTIYLQGKQNEDGTFPTLTLRADDNQAPCLELGGPFAIDNLTVKVAAAANLWISANGNTFTAGANLTLSLEENFHANLTGGMQDASASGALIAGACPTVNIFGGEWDRVYGGSFSKTGSAQATGTVTVNLIGGSVNQLLTHRDGGTQKADAILNIWGGSVNKISGGKFGEGFAPTLNLYNGVLPADSTIINDPFKNGEGGNIHELTGTAPTFEEVSFVTVKEAEPEPGTSDTDAPDNPDVPKPGNTENEHPSNTQKPTPGDNTQKPGTKETNTSGSSAEPAKSDGCASDITPVTAGLFVIAAVLPFAFKKSKRKGETK